VQPKNYQTSDLVSRKANIVEAASGAIERTIILYSLTKHSPPKRITFKAVRDLVAEVREDPDSIYLQMELIHTHLPRLEESGAVDVCIPDDLELESVVIDGWNPEHLAFEVVENVKSKGDRVKEPD
jgi:hypothetical protein